jgi:hypothetical protein
MFGETTSCAVLLTVSVTGIVTGLFGTAKPVDGLVAVIVSEPLQVVPAAMPVVFALIATELDVTPVTALVALFTSSQFPPQSPLEGPTE